VSPAKRPGGGTRKSGGKAVTSSSSGKAAKRPASSGGRRAKAASEPTAAKRAPRRAAAAPVSRRKTAAPAQAAKRPAPRREAATPTRERAATAVPAVPTVPGGEAGSRVFDVLNMKSEKVGRVDLSSGLFATRPNAVLIHEAVVMQQASRRQGSADTKGRAEVSGSGRKPWKQKGTGRARGGSIRSPLWRGGGTVFGPTPRGYGYAFPRKKARAALAGALSAKAAQGDLVVLDELSLTEPKTKAMVGVLNRLGLDGSVLIIHRDESGTLARASRNIRRVTLLDVTGLNVYDVLAHRHILLVQSDLQRIGEVWS
jgi:large subunit ribosomal protein L4